MTIGSERTTGYYNESLETFALEERAAYQNGELQKIVRHAYENAPAEKQRKLDVLLSLRLREATGARDSLEILMREISARAKARGLSEEALSELLRDE